MKIYFINIFSTILLFNSLIFPQQFSTGSPEWLVDMFFCKNSFPDKVKYFSGEMLNEVNEQTIGEELNGKGDISFHQITASNNEIVFAVEVTQNQKVIDFYSYLLNENNTWKIYAIRRFLLPSFIYTVRDSLANLSSLSPGDSTFFLSVQLFTASDNELKNFFKANQNNFQNLIYSFTNNNREEADKILSSIGCNAIYTDKKYPGCVFIQNLEFENMAVGFIQAAESKLLPEISVQEYIYIEEVSPGWFVFRTI